MPEARAGGDAEAPASPPRRVVIEFDPGTDVAGTITCLGPATEFRGRLELYAALERARSGESAAEAGT